MLKTQKSSVLKILLKKKSCSTSFFFTQSYPKLIGLRCFSSGIPNDTPAPAKKWGKTWENHCLHQFLQRD